MPQWRKLHTATVEDWHVHEMPDDFTRLLWLLLPLVLDREGRGIDSPAWVRARVFPLREDVCEAQVEQALAWYAEHGLIERYRAGGRRYFWMPSWRSQQGDCSREAASGYPAPPARAPVPRADPSPPVEPDPCEGVDGGTREQYPTTQAPGTVPAEGPDLRPTGSGSGREQLPSDSRASRVPEADSDADTDSDAETDRHDIAAVSGYGVAAGAEVVVSDIPMGDGQLESLRAELSRYLIPEVARRLADEFPERVLSQIAHYRWARSRRRARGPGWLVRAIMEDWQAPAEAKPWLCAADSMRYITGEYGDLIQH